MKSIKPAIALLLACLFLSSRLAFSQAATHFLIVTGVSGEEEFREKFSSWSSQIYQVLNQEMQFPKESIYLLAEDPSQNNAIVTAKSTKAELAKVFDRLQSTLKTNDRLVILFLGHGSFDGGEYKFNLVGPDVTGSELKSYLDRLGSQEVVIVCTTPSSGVLTRTLSAKNRVIITATKNEFENNHTIFAQFFVEALKNKAADTDKNQQVSMLEAFSYTAKRVESWYKEQKRLATEHPLLEDNGDAQGTGVPSPANGEGLLASKISLGGPLAAMAHSESQSRSPELSKLYSSKHKIEAALQELKYRKASISEAEYQQSLEKLLIQLSRANQQIRNLEKK